MEIRKFLIVISAISAIALTGCSKQQSSQTKESSQSKVSSKVSSKKASKSKEKKSSSSKSASSATSKSTSHSKKAETPWNSAKDQQLASFMSSWGATMNQKYVKYTPNNPGNVYGIKIPNDIYNGKWHLAISDIDNQVSSAWSENGQGARNTYLIVACYSDFTNVKTTYGYHVYLFTIYNGKPVVLISEQNQGNEKNSYVFGETKNNELKNGFTQIVDDTSNTTSSSQTNSSSVTDEELAIMAIMKFDDQAQVPSAPTRSSIPEAENAGITMKDYGNGRFFVCTSSNDTNRSHMAMDSNYGVIISGDRVKVSSLAAALTAVEIDSGKALDLDISSKTYTKAELIQAYQGQLAAVDQWVTNLKQ